MTAEQTAGSAENPFADKSLSRNRRIERWLEIERALLESLRDKNIRVDFEYPRMPYQQVSASAGRSIWAALADYEAECKEDRAVLVTITEAVAHITMDRSLSFKVTPRDEISEGKAILHDTSPYDVKVAYDVTSRDITDYFRELLSKEERDWKTRSAVHSDAQAGLEIFFENIPVTFEGGNSYKDNKSLIELRKVLMGTFGTNMAPISGYEFAFEDGIAQISIEKKVGGNSKGVIRVPYDFNPSELKRTLSRLKKGLL